MTRFAQFLLFFEVIPYSIIQGAVVWNQGMEQPSFGYVRAVLGECFRLTEVNGPSEGLTVGSTTTQGLG